MSLIKTNPLAAIGYWIAHVFSAEFFWWVAKSYLFPSLSFILLFLFLLIKHQPFDIWIDVVARQEVLIVAIAASVATLFDVTGDAILWPRSRRGILSFSVLLFLIVLCAGSYGLLTAQLQPVSPQDRADVVRWIAGLSIAWSLFVQIVISPKPSISTPRSSGA